MTISTRHTRLLYALTLTVLLSLLIACKPQPATRAPTTDQNVTTPSPLHLPEGVDAVTVELTETQGMLFVKDITINGQTLDGWWIVDTGATHTVLDAAHAESVDLKPIPQSTSELHQYHRGSCNSRRQYQLRSSCCVWTKGLERQHWISISSQKGQGSLGKYYL